MSNENRSQNIIDEHNIAPILAKFGVTEFAQVELIDTSHGDGDTRLNYIIDKKYVLRVNSAAVMTDARLDEINRLVRRYKDFGLVAPAFIKSTDGTFVVKTEQGNCYLSEYIDEKLADEYIEKNSDGDLSLELPGYWDEVRDSVIRFAERYKNVDLSDTMSMYSLFELCPYDFEAGIDEKQDNLNSLTKTLDDLGESITADRLRKLNDDTRNELLTFYKELPRCVFQGDENSSNTFVDDDGHFCGLIDFNMSGTDVITNYFANIAGYDLDTNKSADGKSARELFDEAAEKCEANLKHIKELYSMTPQEERAYMLYGKIVLISGWPNVCLYIAYLKDEQKRDKIVELLNTIVDKLS